MQLSSLWRWLLEGVSSRRLERAQAEYETMLELRPSSARLWLRHAEICKRLNRLGRAAVSYRTAAAILRDQHRYSQAAAAFRLAQSVAPTDKFIQHQLRMVEQHIQKGLYEVPPRSKEKGQGLLATELDLKTQIVELELCVEEPAKAPETAFDMKPAEA